LKIRIEIECVNAAFSDDYLMAQAEQKILEQIGRPRLGVICDAPESADRLLDSNGNTVGRVALDVR